MQIELTLEKECTLEPGPYMVKAVGKKLIVEKIESKTAEKKARKQLPKKLDEGKRELEDILADYPGGQFKSAEEVRKYVKEERSSWGSCSPHRSGCIG